MKLKKKLLGFVGAATIGIPTILGVAACSFTRVIPDDYECPTVDFSGDPVMTPNGGVKKFNLQGFTFSRPLYPGEEVKVIVTDVANEPSTIVTGIPSYKQDDDKMSIEFGVTPVSDYADQTFKFKLQFEFTYGEITQTYDGLDKIFTYEYAADWRPNEVEGSLTSYTAYRVENSTDIEFVVDNLTLVRNLDSGEKLEVTVLNGDKVKKIDQEIIEVENEKTYKLKLTFSLEGQSYLNNYDGSFGLKFDFFDTKQRLQKEQTLDTTGTVKFVRLQDEAKVELGSGAPSNATFYAMNGSTTCEFDEDTLVFNRQLNTDYDERLSSLTLTNESGSAVPGLGFTFNSNSTKIFDVAITYNTSVLPQFEEHTYKLLINYEIKEFSPKGATFTPFTGSIPITFTYIPVWKEKTVTYEGIGAGGADPVVFNGSAAAGVRSIDIESYTSLDPVTKDENCAFVVDGKLDSDEKVIITLQNNDSTNPLELGSSEPTYVNFKEDGVDKVLIGFKIKYKESWFNEDPSRVWADYDNASFKLTFQFAVTGSATHPDFYSEPQTLPETFNLHYEADIYDENKLSVGLADKYGDENQGGEHGDTIIKVGDGSLNRAFLSTEDEFVGVTSNVTGISVSNQAGAGYENQVKFDGSSFSMYVQIDPSIITRFDQDQSWDVTFTFTFKHEGGAEYTTSDATEIVYLGFSNKITDYINARVVPISISYKDYSGWHPFFITAWIVGDATPLVANDYTFYIATTADAAETYKEHTNLSYVQSFKVGITDKKFSGKYKYSTDSGSTWSEQIDAHFYQRNYVYFSKQSIVWENKDFTWPAAATETKYASNIRIGKLNFADSLTSWTDGSVVNDPIWINTYLNKLIKLNNYNKLYGHINGIVGPITNSEANYERYQEFGVSGYEAIQYNAWKDSSETVLQNPSNATMTIWKDFTFNTEYVEATSQWSPALTYINPTEYKAKNLKVPLIAGGNLYDGSPAYKANTKWSPGIYNVQKYYGIETLTGSMIAVVDKQADENEDKVKLLGIYWGTDSSMSANDFYPFFDMFYDGTNNLIADYL